MTRKLTNTASARAPKSVALDNLGGTLRQARKRRGLTLKQLAGETGLSTSLLSMVERHQSNPSVGTLVAITDVLGVSMSEIFHPNDPVELGGPVIRSEQQDLMDIPNGVRRRIIVSDPNRGIEFAENHYDPRSSSAESPTKHTGFEIGFVVEGELEVTLDERVHILRPGDAIAFPSDRLHRFHNRGKHVVRTFWINLHPTNR